MMDLPIEFIPVFLVGVATGVLFFGGLWLTVRALPNSKHPAMLGLVSFCGRTGLVLLGLVLVSDGRWQRALVCLAGLVAARFLLTRWITTRDLSG